MSNVNPYVVSAMCGNFAIESTLNPGIWESLTPSTFDHQYEYDDIGGYGLGQWTNVGTPHGRLWNLYQFCLHNRYQVSDGNAQLRFISFENYWTVNYGTIATLNEFLTSDSTDLEYLTMSWLRNWEGIGTETYSQRLAYARVFLTYLNSHKEDDPSQYSWVSGNMYLNDSGMLNNLMCVYFFLKGYEPTPPAPSDLITLLLLFIKKKRRNYYV